MKKSNIKNIINSTIPGLCTLLFISCSGYSTIVGMQEINTVSGGQYERIVKLSNPLGAPNKTLAGVVFVRKGASICTDYPREEVIKNIDELSMIEKNSYRYFNNYEIKEGSESLGYVSLPMDYRAILWKNEKDENCKYKIQIISTNKERDDISDAKTKYESGGGHGN